MTETVFFQTILVCFGLFGLVAFIVLMWWTAPYGRYVQSRGGWMLDAKVGWILMEFPACLGMLFWFVVGERHDTTAIIYLIIWETHYLYRTFIYPFLKRSSGHNMPLLIVCLGLIFNLINTYLNGRYLFHFSTQVLQIGFSSLFGLCLFLIGLAVNIHSDMILRGLRRPGEKEYYIPNKGLFRFVSCPNYFGEIIEWCGWAILTWSIPGLLFAWLTIANLVPRARSNHLWYKQRFPDYPQNRKALLPFVW